MTPSSEGTVQDVIACVKAALCGESHNFPIVEKTATGSFKRLADWHKVMPLVEWGFSPQGGAGQQRILRAERNYAWLRRVCERLEDVQIPVLPLRGLVLAQTVYGDFHRRAMSDLDLLVPPEFAERAMSVLVNLGWRPPFPQDAARRRAYVRFQGECAFLHIEDRTAVDLHWQSVPRCFQVISDGEMWKESERSELGGYLFRSLRPAHLLLHLCSHGTKHGWDRLIYVADFAAACRQFPAEEARVAARDAKRYGKEDMWLLAVALAREVLDVVAPPLTSETVLPSRIQGAVRCIENGWRNSTLGARGGRERKILRVVLRRPTDRWRYWWDIVGMPTTVEIAAIRLPAMLWWGYVPLRWARLATRALRLLRGGAE